MVLKQTLGSYVSLQLDGTDVGEVERKENLPRSNVQRVVVFAEVQSGEVEDAADRKTPGGPLLRIWTEEDTDRGDVRRQ